VIKVKTTAKEWCSCAEKCRSILSGGISKSRAFYTTSTVYLNGAIQYNFPNRAVKENTPPTTANNAKDNNMNFIFFIIKAVFIQKLSFRLNKAA